MKPAPGVRAMACRSARWGLLLVGLLLAGACTRGSHAPPQVPLARDARSEGEGTAASPMPGASGGTAASPAHGSEVKTQGPRPSSFRLRQGKVPGGCDYGEACDSTAYDTLCVAARCEQPRPGDQRCHRVREDGS